MTTSDPIALRDRKRYVVGHGGTGEPSLTWDELAMHHMRIACACMIQAMPDRAMAAVESTLAALCERVKGAKRE